MEKIFWKGGGEVEERARKEIDNSASLIINTRPSPRPQKVNLHLSCCANSIFEADHDYADTPFTFRG